MGSWRLTYKFSWPLSSLILILLVDSDTHFMTGHLDEGRAHLGGKRAPTQRKWGRLCAVAEDRERTLPSGIHNLTTHCPWLPRSSQRAEPRKAGKEASCSLLGLAGWSVLPARSGGPCQVQDFLWEVLLKGELSCVMSPLWAQDWGWQWGSTVPC